MILIVYYLACGWWGWHTWRKPMWYILTGVAMMAACTVFLRALCRAYHLPAWLYW